MKKITALIIALVSVINMSLITAVNAEGGYSKEEQMLISMGFIDSAESNVYLSREAYAKSILSCFGQYEENFFGEVVSGSETSHMELATGMEFIGLYDDGSFNPEGNATMGEVVRGLVTLLGYDLHVNMTSNTARDFFTKGQSIGITKGVNKGFSDNITEKEYAKMLANCIDIPVMMSTYENGEFVIKAYEDESFLSRRHDIYYARGVVTANEYTTLSSPNGVGENVVYIDDTSYYTGDTDCDELLGYFVEFYYAEKDGEYTLVWVNADTNKNGEIYLEDDEIIGFENGVYLYNEGARERKINLSNEVTYIYNNKAAKYVDIPSFVPENGEITFVDNDNNGKYDVVIIMDYVVGIVDDINKNEQFLFVKSSSSLKYEIEEYETADIYNAEFEELSFNSLAEDNAVWIAESLDGLAITILVSDKTVQGTVTGVGESSSGRPFVKIGDEKYEFGCLDLTAPAMNENGVFFIDIDGRIAGFETKNVGYQIGWLLSAYISDEDEYLYIKLFDGDVSSYKVADKFEFNSSRVETYENIISTLKGGNAKIPGQIVRYKMNAKDEVLFLQTATMTYKEKDRLFVEGTIPKQGAGVGVLFKKNYGNLFTNAFALEDDATVFVIPNDTSDYSKYVKGGPEIFGNDATVYGITGYKLNQDDDRCVAAVWDKTIAAGSEASANKPSVVKSINPTLIDDEEGFELVYYDLSTAPATLTEMTAYTTEEEYFNEIESGDMIKIDVDGDKSITGLTKVYSYGEQTFVGTGGYWGIQFRGNFGPVVQKLKNTIKFTVSSSYAQWLTTEMLPLDYCAIYVSRPGRGGVRELEVGTKSDIEVGDTVAYTSRVGQDFRLIVYKDN